MSAFPFDAQPTESNRPERSRTAARPSPVARLRRAFGAVLLVLFFVGCTDGGANAGEGDAMDPGIKELFEFADANVPNRSKMKWRTRLKKPPMVKFDPAKTYSWKLVTSEGPIVIRMRTDVAPMHVSSTFYLTRLGFYDGLGFHRVIQGFMAQGGDPLGNGSGGPGYKYAGEFDPSARHDGPGVLSMANAGPRTDGSQFFLTFKATPFLDDKHTVFGKIEDPDSLAVLKKIELLGGSANRSRPKSPITIEKATILVE